MSETAVQKILICSRADGEAHFADDLFDVCARCGQRVRYRPSAPTDVIRVCFECMPTLAALEGGGTIEVTKATRDELALFYAKPQGGKQ
jgi:hypothetical protein